MAASSAHQVLQHLALEAGEVLRRRGVEDAHGRAEVVSSWLAGLAVDVADRALVPAEPGGGGAA